LLLMGHCIVPTKYLPFCKTGYSMKKTTSIIFSYPTIIQILLLLQILKPQVSGQSDKDARVQASQEIVSGSHLLCAPYRDLNPFRDLPGEVNQWGWGTVYLHTGDSVTGRYLLYNALGSNLLWIKKAGESTGLLVDKSTVKGFSILSEKDNRLQHYEFFPVAGWYYSDDEGAFIEVLVKDAISLYSLVTIEKFPMSENLKAHRYYFIQRKGDELNRVLPNRKNLCRALDHTKEFKKHLKSNHMRVNKRDRIIRAIQEYNRLFGK
jgi:hypothetical protein